MLYLNHNRLLLINNGNSLFYIDNGTPQPEDIPMNIGSGFDDIILVINRDVNNKYIIGGGFTTYQGVSANRIIRLNQDGSRDNTFNIGSGFNSTIQSIIQDNNGKYIIGGQFTTYQGVSANRIIRLNQDGSRDTSFNIGTGFDGTVFSIIQDNNGKYLIGGQFTTYQGVSTNYIIRLNQDGSRDNTFNIGSWFNSTIQSIIQDNNGKYIVGGNFTTYQGVSANRIIRLNQDGSRDNTFNIGTGFNNGISSIIQDTNGKYVVVGNFTTYQGISANHIIRLNEDGSRDNTFNIGSGFNGNVFYLIKDNNNKYIVGGGFTTYQGISANYIIRLNEDGSRDNTFNIGSGFGGVIFSWVRSIIQDSNNKYIIGGSFTTYNGITSNRIIKLNQDGSPLIVY